MEQQHWSRRILPWSLAGLVLYPLLAFVILVVFIPRAGDLLLPQDLESSGAAGNIIEKSVTFIYAALVFGWAILCIFTFISSAALTVRKITLLGLFGIVLSVLSLYWATHAIETFIQLLSLPELTSSATYLPSK